VIVFLHPLHGPQEDFEKIKELGKIYEQCNGKSRKSDLNQIKNHFKYDLN